MNDVKLLKTRFVTNKYLSRLHKYLLKNKRLSIIIILVVINVFLVSVLMGMKYVSFQSGDSEDINVELNELKGNQMNFKELSVYFTELSEKKGADYSYEVLNISDIPLNIDMHLLAHVVGDILYRQEGIDGLKKCTHNFRNACSHTIVIGAFLEKGEAALPEVSKACGEAPGGKGAYTMCFHGLGHGVLAHTEYDLEKAVKLCKKTGTKEYGDQEYIECAGGAVMEMMSGVNDREQWEIQSKKYFDDDDPFAPCSTDVIPKEVEAICYTYLTPHLFEFVGANLNQPTEKDYENAFKLCNRVPKDDENRNICFASFGKEFVVLAQNRDIRKIENMTLHQLSSVYNWCGLSNDTEGRKSCNSSALQSLYWGGENNRTISIDFCGVIEDSTLQKSCFTELIGAVSFYIDDNTYKSEFCKELPNSYRDDCQTSLITSLK